MSRIHWKALTTACAIVVAGLMSSAASAVVIDLSVFPSGDQGSTSLVTPEATFNSFEGNFFIGQGPNDPVLSMCALDATSFNCLADFELVFSGTVRNLTLITTGFEAGDVVEIFAFDDFGVVLDSVVQQANGLVDFSSLSGVARLLIDDFSTANGFGYGAFSFDFDDSITVPEPGTTGLIGAGLLLIFLARRKATHQH